jgi:GNAT superfamily N-acetyltransferase
MTENDRKEVIAVTARAFWSDPLFDFFTGDLLHEYRLLPTIFDAYMKDLAGPEAEVTVADDRGQILGIAGWLAPGSLPRSPGDEARRTARAAVMLLRGTHRMKAFRLLREVERHHPREPHWYLSLLATDPTAQGKGIGSALLAPVLARCDDQEMIAYTETQKEANVPWYARAGFTVAHEVRLPETPPIWCLKREPRVGR